MNKTQQMWSGVIAGVALLVTLGGCDDGTSTGTGSGAQSALGKSAEFAKDVAGDIASRDAQLGGAADALTGAGERVELSGLAWSIPGSWKKASAQGMAQVELVVPGESSYPVRAKFFSTVRGSVADNIARWERMMTYSGGPARSRITNRTLDGVLVTIVEIEGTYADRMFDGSVVNRDLFAFRGAVIEGPRGIVFIKLVGPDEVIEEADADFQNMVSSMRRN